jgi:hypothetical protein
MVSTIQACGHCTTAGLGYLRIGATGERRFIQKGSSMTTAQDQLQNYPQILDGFCYSGLFGTRPLNRMSWYWMALANMENLRAAADSYRPRQWTVPKNFTDSTNPNNANIAPGKTVFYEFLAKPNSWLWGLQFAVYNDTLAQSQFSVVIRQGSDLPFFDRVMCASGIAAGNPIDPFNTLFPPVDLLSEPRLIISPAQLHVELSNDSDPANMEAAISCQLLLLFAEPK